MVGDTEVDNAHIPLYNWLDIRHSLNQVYRRIRVDLERISMNRGENIINLIEDSQDKKCSVPRDRIFSVLALCNDESRIEVDYEIAPQELARNVLRKTLCCVCSAHLVARTLDIQHNVYDGATPRPFAYITLPIVHYAAQTTDVENFSHVAYVPSLVIAGSKMRVIVNLFDICHTAYGFIILDLDTSATLLFDHVTSSIRYEADLLYEQNCLSGKLFSPIRGCTGFVHGTECTLYMSLDALLRLASFAHDAQDGVPQYCCHRIYTASASASADAWYTPTVPFRLCSDD
jgi:hypothetical protein